MSKKNRKTGLNWREIQKIFQKKIQYRNGQKKLRHLREA